MSSSNESRTSIRAKYIDSLRAAVIDGREYISSIEQDMCKSYLAIDDVEDALKINTRIALQAEGLSAMMKSLVGLLNEEKESQGEDIGVSSFGLRQMRWAENGLSACAAYRPYATTEDVEKMLRNLLRDEQTLRRFELLKSWLLHRTCSFVVSGSNVFLVSSGAESNERVFAFSYRSLGAIKRAVDNTEFQSCAYTLATGPFDAIAERIDDYRERCHVVGEWARRTFGPSFGLECKHSPSVHMEPSVRREDGTEPDVPERADDFEAVLKPKCESERRGCVDVVGGIHTYRRIINALDAIKAILGEMFWTPQVDLLIGGCRLAWKAKNSSDHVELVILHNEDGDGTTYSWFRARNERGGWVSASIEPVSQVPAEEIAHAIMSMVHWDGRRRP